MFTDTKNLANASAMDMSYIQANVKSKGKLRKVWKPLLRLISLKSATKNGSGNNNGGAHPNNVNLNNAKDICELSTSLLEDYAAVIRKEASDAEEFITTTAAPTHVDDQVDKSTSRNHSAVISSASFEKTPTSSCTGCVYGRNCQHEQFHHDYDKCNSVHLPVIDEPSAAEVDDVPVHYVRTDDGTFFWTTVQDKIDDDLLHAWLCQSFQQFPVQSTMC